VSAAARGSERRTFYFQHSSAGGVQHVFAGRHRASSASQYQQGSSIAAIANRRYHQQEHRQHRHQYGGRLIQSFRHDDRSRSVVATPAAAPFSTTTSGPHHSQARRFRINLVQSLVVCYTCVCVRRTSNAATEIHY